MAKEAIESLNELQKAEVADCILPGILTFLDKLLARESISDELEALRRSYVAILKCTTLESRLDVRNHVELLAESLDVQHETTSVKSGKFGRIREKRLINIRQFHLKQNQRKQERKNKMDSTDDESRLIPKARKQALTATDVENECHVGQVNLGTDDESRQLTGTDDESRYLTITDDERRISMSSEGFVELSRSQDDLTSPTYSKLANENMNKGPVYHKEGDGLRQRWLVLDANVLKCYKRQNHNLLFEVNFSQGDFSAMQGHIGKMFAIRLSGTKASSSHLFASPKPEVAASWLMAFSRAGVRLQDDILREVSMNQQNNNKVKWSLNGKNFPEKDEYRSELLEAIDFIERSRGPCILPKRSSYSFKELDVLKKLKSSLVAKKAECKLNRRKTWSAGSFPITNLVMLEKFRKPMSASDGNGLTGKKEDEEVKEMASKSLPEILTSSGVVQVSKEDRGELETPVDKTDQLVASEEELCYAKSMPEGLNKEPGSRGDEVLTSASISAQSVPDLLILPVQESPHPQSSPPKMEGELKRNISLTRVMSMKASLVKNAIISGWKRKGRRGSGLIALDQDLSDVHGVLFRKKGMSWKQRWCAVSGDIFYAFRDSQYTQEDFRCSLRKCYVVTSCLEPGHVHGFRLVRRKGEEIVMAAKDGGELERWMTVLKRETSKYHLYEGNESRSSSLTVSLFGSDTVGDSSAAEDTPPETGNNYCETTDKDSSDEHSTASSISTKIKSRGLHEKGYVYYLVKMDTWEHCWMELSFGVLSIYNNETKGIALERHHAALCDIQHDTTNEQRSYSFVLKKAGRHPIYFAVNSESDFLKWQECFNSWKKRSNEETTASIEDTPRLPGLKNGDVMPLRDNFLTIPPMSYPVGGTPVTSDSDCCCSEATDTKSCELERPKIRRSVTDVLSQITPKLKRRSHSSAGTLDASNNAAKNVVKSSFLYYRASSGLWVKYWCVLDSAVVYCFNTPEDGEPCFSVEVSGCEIKRTSCKSKHNTFDVFNRTLDRHHEFAGESMNVMYTWMRDLKSASGSTEPRASNSDELPASKSEELGIEATDVKRTGDSLGDESVGAKDSNQEAPASPPENMSTPRTSISAPTSPKKKAKITSLDEVLKLLHEKRLEQELQTKQLGKSERARMKWQHAMLVALRKSRTMRTHSSSENLKSSGSFGSDSVNAASPESDEKATKVKYREISAKYDKIFEDERLKMLRRETLLKKRRNSLILRQEMLQKKLGKVQDGARGTLRKRQSKSDAKEMATSFSKGGNEEVKKQLVDISVEIEGIKQEIESSQEEQQRISEDLNEQKRKEMHELRISPSTSKTNLYEGKSLHRRQVSDSSLSEKYRKMTVNDNTLKMPLTHTMSSPSGDIRTKAKSFSSPSVPKVKSNPLLRTKTYDSTDGLKRPNLKAKSSQETLSLALSQIEDFEAFVQDSFRNCGADVGC